MRAARSYAVVLTLVAAGACRGQSVPLAEQPLANDCFTISLVMKLQGEMVVVQEGKQSTLKVTATADHRFSEKVLTVDATRLISKTARHYQTASSTVTVDSAPVTRTLRPERALAVAQRVNDTFLAYSPKGPLTREELDVVAGHFDTLCLPGLLPQTDVKIGETWKISSTAAQGLCLFEGLIAHELTGKLTEVKGDTAVFTIQGTAKGIDIGAHAALTINATGRFDLKQKRVVGLEWKQQDQRDQGPASPAMKSDLTATLTRAVTDVPRELAAAALESVPSGSDVPPALTQLTFRDPQGRFELTLPRDWHLVGQTDRHTIMRLLDRGDFVAQVTITPWEKAEPGQHIAPEKFKEAMLTSPGWEAENVIQEGVVPGKPGRWCYRVAATGTTDDVKVVQTFFVVAGPQGDQVVFAFTTRQAQAAKLGAQDVTFVEGIEFPGKK